MLLDALDRQAICFPKHKSHDVLQYGDPDFEEELARHFPAAEGNAIEALGLLKARLQKLSTDDFFSAVTEGLCELVGADMSFVMKRILVDERNAAIEMPPHGEPGSCMMAAAFHYNSNDGSKLKLKGNQYSVYGCPCAYMKHDKVFLIPDRLNDFITHNPNTLPTPAEAYMAVPLFAEGKNFAHFGVMWSKEAAIERRLSWPFIELLLHSLEDLIQYRLMLGADFMRATPAPDTNGIVPHDAVSIAQSLRPYAGSLSHELRTPMQGIVGMLDVMYATVQEAQRSQTDQRFRKTFEDLKENIEVVQDSSRRAVEAADNVVHAYDMDMSVPDRPEYSLVHEDADCASPFSSIAPEKRPEIFVAGSNLPLSRKRRRDDNLSRHSSNASDASNKLQKLGDATAAWSKHSEPSQQVKQGLQEAELVQIHAQAQAQAGAAAADLPAVTSSADTASDPAPAAVHRMVAPGLRHTNMREVFRYIIGEGLKMGGRPESALAQETTYGETIEVRSRGSDGTLKTKWLVWKVDPSVPTTVFIDEKDLSKLISCVVLNALKFTDQDGGRVGMHAKLSSKGTYVSIKVSDNGPGIPAAFLPKLFQAFSRENASITRSSEGLGLGLMVAKGIARKLGGDLMCTRAETKGPNHGSDFEIRVPVMAGEMISRPSSPMASPMPRRATVQPVDLPKSPLFSPPTDSPRSPSRISRALHDVMHDNQYSYHHPSSAPASPKTLPSQPPIACGDPAAVAPTSSPALHTCSVPSPDALERARLRKSVATPEIDRQLATKYPLTFLVAEDNKINRKLLVSMLKKFGYRAVYEAHDGIEAVRQMKTIRERGEGVDVILMDLWMPLMDGYEATQRILSDDEDLHTSYEGAMGPPRKPTVLAVTADVTDGAQEKAALVGMKGFMTKPYKIGDLQRLITEFCARKEETSVTFAD